MIISYIKQGRSHWVITVGFKLLMNIDVIKKDFIRNILNIFLNKLGFFQNSY